MPLLPDSCTPLHPGPREAIRTAPWTSFTGTETSPSSPSVTFFVPINYAASSTGSRPEAPSPPQSAGMSAFLPSVRLITEDHGSSPQILAQALQPTSSVVSDAERDDTTVMSDPPQSPGGPPSTPISPSVIEAPTPPAFTPYPWSSSDPAEDENASEPLLNQPDAPPPPDNASATASPSDDRVHGISELITRCNGSSFATASREVPIAYFRLQGWVGSAPEDSTMISLDTDGTDHFTSTTTGSWLDQVNSEMATNLRLQRRWEESLSEILSAFYALHPNTYGFYETARGIAGLGAAQHS